jgi:hypothetical protein
MNRQTHRQFISWLLQASTCILLIIMASEKLHRRPLFLLVLTLSVVQTSSNLCDSLKNIHLHQHGPNFYHFIVEQAILAPDNFIQTGITINGIFPGPTSSRTYNRIGWF